ncbi:uncharacterized protein LOC112538999 [Tetranychus urticae]|uniref:uncharacterized protein LOC112538999 n=1 Tax=Tetranychus urticae TaxID=32264 RepID=UPI000D647706|nr:uncharacterized protein LOC112538999 [Tetranychus urticae]
MFKPLVISAADPIPYPLSYGCERKNTQPSTPLPDFSKVEEFIMDMEALITYPDRELIKSTARVMKRGDLISYKIQEGTKFVRSIEMPPPLGRFQVDEHTGQCNYYTSHHSDDVTLISSWPLAHLGFNLFYYLLMKPPQDHAPTFIGDIPLGPFRVEEYKAHKFLSARYAIVDYYYTKNVSDYVPSKVIFTIERMDRNIYDDIYPKQVEVTIINYQTRFIDYEDRFDVSGCYEEPGSYTWFQLLFPNPELSNFKTEFIKEKVEEYLASFIPITRIGEIHARQVDPNVYVTVKLYDRVHFIDVYNRLDGYKIINPSNVVKRFKVEDCEQLCSANSNCKTFSHCDDYDCSIYDGHLVESKFKAGCSVYTRPTTQATPFVSGNYLSPIPQILQQIRNKVAGGEIRLRVVDITAEGLFIVSGPEEIGDIFQELHSSVSRPLRGEDFPMIQTDRHFNEAQFKIEKSTLQDCFMACLNDDDCNTLSYCVAHDKECILSGETSSSLQDLLENKTSHADGCNIYQRKSIVTLICISYINFVLQFQSRITYKSVP